MRTIHLPHQKQRYLFIQTKSEQNYIDETFSVANNTKWISVYDTKYRHDLFHGTYRNKLVVWPSANVKPILNDLMPRTPLFLFLCVYYNIS